MGLRGFVQIQLMKSMSDNMIPRQLTKKILQHIRQSDTLDCDEIIPELGITIGQFAFNHVRKNRSLRAAAVLKTYKLYVQRFQNLSR